MLTRLDLTVLATGTLLVATLLIVILTGDTAPEGVRVAFVRPDANAANNLFILDPDDPDDIDQLTFAENGIFDYNVSPDGSYIAYAVRDMDAPNRNAEIMLLDLRTGETRQLTNCVMQDADCTTPAWRPGNRMIAYQRVELNSALSVGVSPNRVWLLDLSSNPVTTYPLVEDSQVLGYSPIWSPDGSRLAAYDTSRSGIMIYDFSAETTEVAILPTTYGTVGAFSPDGSQLIFPELLPGGPLVRAALQIADLSAGEFSPLTEENREIDDQGAAWHPDGDLIAITRRYLDPERLTRGHQLFLADVNAGTVTELIYDERYIHSFFSWSPDGTQLLMNRFPALDENGDPNADGKLEIWTYDMATGDLTRLIEDAYQPRWVP